jgi:hypothetical protein
VTHLLRLLVPVVVAAGVLSLPGCRRGLPRPSAPAAPRRDAVARDDPKAITFVRSVPRVGTIRVEQGTLELTFSVTRDGTSLRKGRTETWATRTEVLATRGDRVTRRKVTFDAARVRENREYFSDEEQELPSTLRGRTYRFTWGDGGLEVTDEKKGSWVPVSPGHPGSCSTSSP